MAERIYEIYGFASIKLILLILINLKFDSLQTRSVNNRCQDQGKDFSFHFFSVKVQIAKEFAN